MSIVSGFMMGAAIGNGVRRFFAGTDGVMRGNGSTGGCCWKRGAEEALALVAAIPGRRRYRAAGLTQELAALLEDKLKQMDFVRSVKANAVSGSLLFVYDAAGEQKMDELEEWMKRKIFRAKREEGVDRGDLPSETHAGSLTRSIRRMGRSFSAWIKAQTNGIFDISSLTSIVFLLRGVRKILMTGQCPSGPQMLWWALSLMRGWRTV